MSIDLGVRPRLHIVATPGGHLDLLLALRDAFDRFDRTWVVSEGSSAQSLRSEGERVQTLPRFHGYSVRNMGHAARSISPLIRDRPRLVVTAGSGSVVPYCFGARAMGARLVFIETMARITNGSAAGRALAPFASRMLVQWPELTAIYPAARVCRPALLEGVPTRLRPQGGRGTFVAVGTHIDPFDRLLQEVDRAVERGVLDTPVIAQSGVSGYLPRTFRTAAWMTAEEMDRAISDTRYTVTHAGCGLIARALRAHRLPMVLPRRAALGEHVDDHQLQIADRLSEYGLIVRLDGQIEPGDATRADAAAALRDDFGDLPRMQDALAEELEILTGSSARDPVSSQSAVRVGAG